MFYNSFRATQSAMRQRQLSGKHASSIFINPKERLLNMPKRQKLKNLLITKFIQKYNIKNPDTFLIPAVTDFIQTERLNDTDLKRLDNRIQKLLKNSKSKESLKSTLTKNLQNINIPDQNDNQSEIINENKFPISPTQKISNTTENEKVIKNNEFPAINPLKTYTNTIPQNDDRLRNRGISSYSSRGTKTNYFKSPAEELAELEKELSEEEDKTKKNYKRIDFTKDGNEWNAILKYNKKLNDRQVLEEKMKDREVKKRTKDYLDLQIKEKLKREYEDELKEKEYNKIVQEHAKKLDEMEEMKSQKIKEQIKRLKENRDEQLKNEKMRKKIEELKEKKFDMKLVKNYKENLERVRKEKIEKKRRENEALRKAIKENELKQKILKEKIKKEKEEDIKMNEERMKLDLRKENERNRYYENIQAHGNKFSMKQAEEILEKLKKDQKAEDEKIQYYYDAKNKEANEKQVKERLRRQKERQDIKRFLDMQIEERKKEENLLKLLDEEQARIWNIDCQKYFDDEKIAEKKIKLMNKKNFECLLNQIEEKRKSKSKQNIMSDNEYAMNREILEKAEKEEKIPLIQ